MKVKNSLNVKIGSRLQEIRESQGLSLEDLSSQTGIGLIHLIQIEKGKGSTSIIMISRITQALNASVEIVELPKLK